MQPIYSTSGDWVALLHEGRLYDTLGEWIAWLNGKEVFNRDGQYVGYLSDDQRILRKRIREDRTFRTVPKGGPTKVRPPSSVPLPPFFAETPWDVVDVFEEDPNIFRYVSDLRPDWEG